MGRNESELKALIELNISVWLQDKYNAIKKLPDSAWQGIGKRKRKRKCKRKQL